MGRGRERERGREGERERGRERERRQPAYKHLLLLVAIRSPLILHRSPPSRLKVSMSQGSPLHHPAANLVLDPNRNRILGAYSRHLPQEFILFLPRQHLIFGIMALPRTVLLMACFTSSGCKADFSMSFFFFLEKEKKNYENGMDAGRMATVTLGDSHEPLANLRFWPLCQGVQMTRISRGS
ncbi:hypothetical protein IE53DRAFT_115279 [Violaceomyces palustris]|uniref:Uncharacterized protein n=1 Tax=Violaceomyces palustris TaxID=1673888 RepID=A0ACD0NW40_9BASI|nr:hypothetical protein IE53DRAFT_115279 [Violaceomyces palustris]